MNDHDFDAFFRKAAEQHRAPYKPGAWEKMRRKLYPPQGGWGTKAKIIAGIVLLFLIGGSLGTALWYDVPEDKTMNTKEPSTERISANNEAVTEKAIIEKEAQLAEPDLSKKNTAQQVPTPKVETKNEAVDQSENPTMVLEENESTGSTNFTLEEFQTSSEDWMNALGIDYLSRRPIGQRPLEPIVSLVLMQPVDSTAEVYPVDQQEAQSPNMRWRISFGVSPDISAINLGKASQVGNQSKIGIEYFIFPRLSVQTGVTFSNKVYTADGESYKPYPGYWKKYKVPYSIDAQCDVLDIPINLRYYAVNLPRSRVFISSGLSSYIMLTEDYVYQYRGSYGKKPYSYEHHERNENRHYFKVANVSLGYERILSKRWALQVEPFVKVPVAGVGFGKIKLSTTGMFVSLNYRLR